MSLDTPDVASGPVALSPDVVPGLLSDAGRRLAPRVPSQHAQATSSGPVVAVLVCHNGELWLPETLAGLRDQQRRPDRVVAVDTGSRDGTSALLASALDEGLVDEIVRLDRRAGFGTAVQAAVAHSDLRRTRGEEGPDPLAGWLWLLHDDAAPEPAALAALVETAVADPGIAVVGPKLVGGRDGRRLLEVGAGLSAGGRRMTGLDAGEVDQGQRDDVDDVLAVSTAGMLVRRATWHELGGLDPALPLFADDLDIGWRARLAGHRVLCEPSAVVRHTEAARRGLRPLDVGRRFPRALRRHPHLAERRAAGLVLLMNTRWLLLPLVAFRLAAGALARAAGLVASSAPRAAAGELAAVAGALLRVDLVVAGRWRRRGRRRVPHRDVRPYVVQRPGHRLRDAGSSVLAAATVGRGRAHARRRDAGALFTLALGLLAVGVWPLRGLVGAPAVAGASALPAPASLAAALTSVAGGWSAVGTGAPGRVAGAAGLLPLGLVSLLVGGFPALAATVLVLLCIPAAGVSAALALRPLVASRAVRCWAGAAYALLPGVVGAAWAGRPLSALAAVALPLLARLALAAVGPVVPLRWAATWAGGLLLALVTAAAPVVGLAALPVGAGVAASGLVSGTRVGLGRALRAIVCLAGAGAVLLPQLRALGSTPYAVLAGAENPQPAPRTVLDLLLLHPGGAGSLPLLLSVPVLAAGLAALLVGGSGAPAVRWAWLLALAGVGAACALVAAPGVALGGAGDPAVVPWTGPALAFAGLGVVTAAALGVQAGRARLRRRHPGWRHVAAAALAVVAVAGPAACAAALVSAARPDKERPSLAARPTPLHAGRDLVPAFVSADLGSGDRPRALVLDPARDGSLRWELVRREVAHLGAPAATDGAMPRTLGDVVASLVSGQGPDAATSLAAAAVRYVVAPAPVDPDLRRTLDATPGLVALGPSGSDGVWQVSQDSVGPAARLRVADSTGRTLAALPSGDVRAQVALPSGAPARALVLAESRDPGWRATLDGVPLAVATPPADVPWAQAWRLPAGGGTLHVWYAGAADRGNLLEPLSAGGVLALLATSSTLAARRRRLDQRRAEGVA